MGEKGFFIVFGIVILAMFIQGINGNLTATNTTNNFATNPTTENTAGNTTTNRNNTPSTIRQGSVAAKPTPQKSNEEVKVELEKLYDELWELEQKVDKAQRRQPTSRYAGQVTFSATRVNRTPEQEYLTLVNTNRNTSIDISDWYLESYVTEKRVAIPDGVLVYKAGGSSNRTVPVILQPSQRAYLVTGESPLNVSFRENSCFGYLSRETTFYPRINTQCERPIELMDRYAENIALDDDGCYAFVSRISSCTTVEDDAVGFSKLSGSCRNFIEKTFSYNNCVAQFSQFTTFDDSNDWYLYFNKDESQWRGVREIIRLRDEFDDIVAVIEY